MKDTLPARPVGETTKLPSACLSRTLHRPVAAFMCDTVFHLVWLNCCFSPHSCVRLSGQIYYFPKQNTFWPGNTRYDSFSGLTPRTNTYLYSWWSQLTVWASTWLQATSFLSCPFSYNVIGLASSSSSCGMCHFLCQLFLNNGYLLSNFFDLVQISKLVWGIGFQPCKITRTSFTDVVLTNWLPMWLKCKAMVYMRTAVTITANHLSKAHAFQLLQIVHRVISGRVFISWFHISVIEAAQKHSELLGCFRHAQHASDVSRCIDMWQITTFLRRKWNLLHNKSSYAKKYFER